MAKYSEIKRVIPLWSRLVTVVGRSWKVEEWECIAEVRGRTGKLRREVVGRLDEDNARKNKTAKTAISVYGLQDGQGLTIVQGRVARVGLGCQGAVSWCPGGMPYHHYGLACYDLAKWLSHYLYFFSFLFLFLWTYNYKVERGKVSCDFVTMSQMVTSHTSHSHKVSHD